jgi:hypothetical protein
MCRGLDAATNRRCAAAGRPQTNVDSSRDVVDITDRLPDLRQGLLQLFIGRVQQLLHGAERSAQPDQDSGQGQRHHEGGHPEGQPHEALTVQPVNTLRPVRANTSAILSASAGVARFWFPGLRARARHEARQRLQEERERGGGQHVGLSEAGRREAEEIPQLAQAETERGHQQDRKVRAAPVGQEGEAELGEDQDGQDPDDQAGRDEPKDVQSAPSGSRGWVVLSELRWVPCLGFPSPVSEGSLAGIWSLSGLRGP